MKLLFISLLVIFSVVKAEWTLSVRLVSYSKQYSLVSIQGTRLEYCCCNCDGVPDCCDPVVTTVNPRCTKDCGIRLSVCGRQGSGPSMCSNTTSSIPLGRNATFEENRAYGGLQNPIQIMFNNLSSENIILEVSVMNQGDRISSLGSFSVPIPPQLTTSYSNRMTSSTHDDEYLSASITYDYRLTCSSESACPSSSPSSSPSPSNSPSPSSSPSPTGSSPGSGMSSVLVKSSIWLLILITLLISVAAVH